MSTALGWRKNSRCWPDLIFPAEARQAIKHRPASARMRLACGGTLASEANTNGAPILSKAHSSSSLGGRQGNPINRSDFQFRKLLDQAVPYVRVAHAFPQIRHLARVDFKVKELIRTFAEINRQTPTVLDDRMHAWPGSERFLHALGVVLDKRRIAPGVAGGGRGLAMHAGRSFQFRVLKYRGADVDHLSELIASSTFPSGRIRLADGSIGETKQPIGCRDDVLDFRARLRLKNRNGVNQYGLIREDRPLIPESALQGW